MNLGRQASCWMERKLVPVCGLHSEYIFGSKDVVMWWQKGCKVGSRVHGGHVKIALSSQTITPGNPFERNVINLPVSESSDMFKQMLQPCINQAVEN